MNFELKSLDLSGAGRERCDALIVLVPAITTETRTTKGELAQIVTAAVSAGDLETKAGKLLMLYRHPGVNATRVVLAGAGDGSARQIRAAVTAAVGAIKGTNTGRLCLLFAFAPTASVLRSAVKATADASYVYATTKSRPEARKLRKVVVGVPKTAGLEAAMTHALAEVAGIELAKEWANRPANHATPTMLADAARALGKLPKVRCEVLGPREVAKLGMRAFMAVAQGSEEPLRLIVLHYDGAPKAQAPVALIGKGITFDTGGISIKPAPEMDEMKFDMCGAASVLGTFRALAELKPRLNVIGLIPACENLPDGRAVKPGDVVTSMSGQTIEILNTDAEGRLVLCDALTYVERFRPRAVVDIATLTGACVIALGGVRSGMFATDDTLAQDLLAAGEASADPCWRMPLDDEYAEGLKTHFADVANVAGRAAGAVTAAKFLQRFSTKFAWAHLDIAGTAWKSGAAKGATGRPVGLLIDFLQAQATKTGAAAPSRVVRAGVARKK